MVWLKQTFQTELCVRKRESAAFEWNWKTFQRSWKLIWVLQLMGVGFELGCDEGEFVSPTGVQSLLLGPQSDCIFNLSVS